MIHRPVILSGLRAAAGAFAGQTYFETRVVYRFVLHTSTGLHTKPLRKLVLLQCPDIAARPIKIMESDST